MSLCRYYYYDTNVKAELMYNLRKIYFARRQYFFPLTINKPGILVLAMPYITSVYDKIINKS